MDKPLFLLRTLRQSRGFTLIEVMIVVAIVAILAAVAIPSYNDYLRRGSLPEAFTFLSNYRVQLEQYYQDHRNFGTAGGDCFGTWGTARTSPAGASNFQFSCTTTAAGDGYTLTATGVGAHSTGHNYSLTEANAKGTTRFKGSNVSGKACWLVRGSEC